MVARAEGEQELDGHSVHVGHGQDAQRVTELRHLVAQVLLTEINVTPQGTVGEHDTLRKTRCTTGVVNHAHLFGGVFIPMDILLAEGVGILVTEHLIQMFARIH